MLNKEEQIAAVRPDPELAEYLAQNPFPNITVRDLEGYRSMSRKGTGIIESLLKKVPEEIEEYGKQIAMRDGHLNQIQITKPAKKAGGPLIVLYHGGGFVTGHPIAMIPTGRVLALAYDAVVVSLGYRFAPENPFPAPAHDAIDGFQWCIANAAELGADTSKGFLVGGISAGGNLSAIVAQYAADNDVQPPLTGLWQNVTCLMHSSVLPEKYKDTWVSRLQDGPRDAIVLANSSIEIVDSLWKPDYKSALFTPFNSPTAFKGIPTTFFQVCGEDPLRDDSYVFEDALKEAGVKTQLLLYPGTPHAYSAIFPTLKISKKFRVDTIRGFGWLLGKDIPDENIESFQAASINLSAV